MSIQTDLISDISDLRIAESSRNEIKKYVTTILGANLPLIWGYDHFSNIAGVKLELLLKMVHSTPSFYRTFEIPKRREGFRTISTPTPALMYTQRWISENLISTIHTSLNTHGYVKGRSIITNAQTHLGGKHLLKMDLRAFFPSIKLKRVIPIFQNMGYPHYVSYMLASLCTLRGSLPQGAPTSPAISNIIAKRLDKRLNALAMKWNLQYTRYADDLAFSGDHITGSFVQVVTSIIEDEQFAVNETKTRLLREGQKKIITGISIGTGKMALPKIQKRKLRQEAYFLIKNGLLSYMKKTSYSDPLYLDRLIGRIGFWKQLEPDNAFVKHALEQLTSQRNHINNLEL